MDYMDEFANAKFHKNYSERLYHIVKNQPKDLVMAQATVESRKLYNMNRQVGFEIHKINSFLRFDVSPHGIMFTEFSPENKVEKKILGFFTKRFPTFAIILCSHRGCFVSIEGKVKVIKKPMKEVILSLEKGLPINHVALEISESDDNETWDTYYDTQFIKRRRNKKYFLNMIPKKWHKMKSLQKEAQRYSRSKDLKEFF